MTGELTLLIMRLSLLAILWIFIFFIVYAIKSDLFGFSAQAYKDASTRWQISQSQESAAASGVSSSPSSISIISGPKSGTKIPLTKNAITIGRAKDSDLVIQDDYTSTKHAYIFKQNNIWVINDLDSTNGTYVNEGRISAPTVINTSSVIRVGRTTFKLE